MTCATARDLRRRWIAQTRARRAFPAFPGKRRRADRRLPRPWRSSEFHRLAEQDVRNRERWIAWSNRWYLRTGRIATPPAWILRHDK